MNQSMAYVLIMVGLICLGAGVYTLTSKKKNDVADSGVPKNSLHIQPQKPSVKFNPKESFQTIDNTVDLNPTQKQRYDKELAIKDVVVIERDKSVKYKKQSDNKYEENKRKGDDFEKFVVQQFSRKYFRLQEWRSDKYVDGVYAASNHFPDLEINFRMGKINDSFAVECKWRKGYYNDEIEWAENYQLDNYKKYASKMQLPVFIILGIGGSPQSPEKLYIIPLSELNDNTINRKELYKYEKRNKQNFYWDEKGKKLS